MEGREGEMRGEEGSKIPHKFKLEEFGGEVREEMIYYYKFN
jgi:hypothetical protein